MNYSEPTWRLSVEVSFNLEHSLIYFNLTISIHFILWTICVKNFFFSIWNKKMFFKSLLLSALFKFDSFACKNPTKRMQSKSYLTSFLANTNWEISFWIISTVFMFCTWKLHCDASIYKNWFHIESIFCYWSSRMFFGKNTICLFVSFQTLHHQRSSKEYLDKQKSKQHHKKIKQQSQRRHQRRKRSLLSTLSRSLNTLPHIVEPLDNSSHPKHECLTLNMTEDFSSQNPSTTINGIRIRSWFEWYFIIRDLFEWWPWSFSTLCMINQRNVCKYVLSPEKLLFRFFAFLCFALESMANLSHHWVEGNWWSIVNTFL